MARKFKWMGRPFYGAFLNISLAQIEVTYFVGYRFNGNDKKTCLITCCVANVSDESGGPLFASKKL